MLQVMLPFHRKRRVTREQHGRISICNGAGSPGCGTVVVCFNLDIVIIEREPVKFWGQNSEISEFRCEFVGASGFAKLIFWFGLESNKKS